MNKLMQIMCAAAIGFLFLQPAAAEINKVNNDFDGDGKSDVAIYHPGSGDWWVFLMGSGRLMHTNVGGGNYLPAPGDYDGDNKTDFMVFDSGTGNWWGKFSTGTEGTGVFGAPGMWPVPADYDGDRFTDPAVYDPLTGMWHILSLNKGWVQSGLWGYLGDFRPWENPQTYTVLPMPFDYNQDGTDDLGYYYRGWSMEDSRWSILYLNEGDEFYTWGSSGSLPAPGNYQVAVGEAPRGICVYKITGADWAIPYRCGFTAGTYGETLPVSACDYDGNGFDDNAVYNYVTGDWTIIFNTGSVDVVGREQVTGNFGGPGMVPANLYNTIYALARYSTKPW